jgi:hypothetical protein
MRLPLTLSRRLLTVFGVAAIAALGAVAPNVVVASNCENTAMGLVPLTDLAGATYRGVEGGLYPGSVNVPSSHHLNGGLIEAASVVPRDTAGTPDPDSGQIVVLTIGMSNCSQESNAFIMLAEDDPLRDPRVFIVNGAQPSQTAEIIDDPEAPFWDVIDERLAERGLTPQQVQAVWFKETNQYPTQPFPFYPNLLKDEFATIMQIIRDRFVNARLCYCSSRTYGGYASIELNPEPYAYHSGFAVKWLIEDQMSGDPALNYAASHGEVESPWIAWGPYLWADGMTPRSDGLIWECADFWEIDGTHPSTSGELKVAQMLLEFFHSDPTAASWYIDDAFTGVSPPAHGGESSSGAAGDPIVLLRPHPNPFNPGVVIPLEVRVAGRARIDVLSVSGRRVATLVDRTLGAGTHEIVWDGLDDNGVPVGSGTYFLQLGNRTKPAHKLTLVR